MNSPWHHADKTQQIELSRLSVDYTRPKYLPKPEKPCAKCGAANCNTRKRAPCATPPSDEFNAR